MMEPFLEYMTGGPCYECGGKTKYAGGGATQGADEQAQKLMGFLTEQISKGTSPSILLKTLVQSGIKQEQAQELVGMAAQAFEQQFQQGLEARHKSEHQGIGQQDHMSQNPFDEEESQQQIMKYGGLRKFIEGGFEPKNEVRLDNANAPYTVKETDPEYLEKLKDPSNITVTDRNKVSNIKDTKFNRGLAYMSGLSNPNSAFANIPDAGGFGAGLKFLAGAAGFLGSAGLGIKKFTADDRTRMYDKEGNILSDSQNPNKYVKTIDKTYTPSTPATQVLTDANSKFNSQPTPVIPSSYANNTGMVGADGKPIGPINTSYAKSKEEPMEKLQSIRLPTPEEIQQIEKEKKLQELKEEGTIANQNAGEAKYDAVRQFNNVNHFRPDISKQKISTEESDARRQVQDRMDAGLGFEDGGEWNPFVDNRRRLKFTMPLYNNGGKIMTYQEWLGVNNLGQGMTAGDDFTEDYNKYVEAQKKQQATNTIQRGDELGKVVANNAVNGMQMMANATDYFVNQKKEDEAKRKMIMSGNTMEAAPVVNPVNPYGSMYTLNAGPGANQNVAQLGYTFDLGTTMASAKYGGLTQYKKGGVYQVSPEELQRIIDMGGEVEFLD